MRLLPISNIKFKKLLSLWTLAVILFSSGGEVLARKVLFQEEGENNSDNFILDADDSSYQSVDLEFGTALGGKIQFDKLSDKFAVNKNVDFQSNEAQNLRLENLALAPSCDNTVKGQLYHDTITTHAYVCDGNNWKQIDNVEPSEDFINGGEASGADRSLGNSDNYDLSLLTNNQPRILIQNDGNVGIGTTSPSTTLEVAGIIKTSPQGIAPTCDANTEGGIYYDDNTDHVYICNGSVWTALDTSDNEFSNGGDTTGANRSLGNDDAFALSLETNNTTRLHIESDGDIGMGTLTPQADLEVNGTIRTTPQAVMPLCDASTEGSIYYDETNKHLYVCDGTLWQQMDGEELVETDLAVVQARRITNFVMTNPGVWYDVDLPLTDIENDALTLDHNDANRDNINVLYDGIYRITYQITANNGGVAHNIQSRVQVNNTTVLNGSLLENVNYQNEYAPTTATFVVSLAAGDYITLQAIRSTNNTIINETLLTIVKLEGVRGPIGPAGVAGQDGDFLSGGDSSVTNRVLGNNDTYDLGLETDGQTRLHIESNGNIGIGTTSPAGNLEVSGTILWSPQISEPSCEASTEGSTYYNDSADAVYLCDGSTWGEIGGSKPSGDFSDGGEGSGADRSLGNTDNYDLGLLTDGTTRLHIQNDGNVGIGTTSPDTALEVTGVIKMTPQGVVPTCDATTEGGTYYDSTTDHAYLCNGLIWRQIDGGSGGDYANGGD